MNQSTVPAVSRDEQSSEAINTLLEAATGLSPYELQWYLRNSTSLSSEMAWDRLARGHAWMVSEVFEIADLWEITPSTLVKVLHCIMEDIDPFELVIEFDLDRRPYITRDGDAL